MSEEWVAIVPRDESSRLELLATRPPLWEYLLFGAALYAGIARTEPKWRDYSLGYTLDVGPVVTKSQLLEAMSARISTASAIAANIEKVISQRAQEAAFGLPGVPGDADLIEHMGGRLIALYEKLLDWAAELRSLRLPDAAQSLPELAVAFVAQPIDATRAFVTDYILTLEREITLLSVDPKHEIQILMSLNFTLAPAVSKRFSRELKRVAHTR